jgi:dUTP pyrophosphatase
MKIYCFGNDVTMAYNNYQAGFDLKADKDYIISAKGKAVIDTNTVLQIRLNLLERLFFKGFIKIFSKSGLSAKYDLECGAGVIDMDYTGEIKVILYNHGQLDYQVKKGDKIAQAVPFLIPKTKVLTGHKLKIYGRGAKGFGSSGR